MKINTPVTGKEKTFSEKSKLVSTTNLKGAITHADANFIDVSGFDKDELIGKNHNVVRHPDMPPAAFEDLWSTLKSGHCWMGIVKNRCKNGDHYWVDAFVGPISENGESAGYQSVRVKPSKEQVGRAEALYERITAGKVGKHFYSSVGYANKLWATISGFSLLLIAAATLFGGLGWLSAGTLCLGALIAGFFLARWVAGPVVQLANETRGFFDNDLARYVYGGRTDEIGQIKAALHMQHAKMRTTVGRVEDAVSQLGTVTTDTSTAARQTREGVQRQRNDTDQLAAAVTEMAASIQEVARNTSQAAVAAGEANSEADKVRQIVKKTIDTIQALQSVVMEASTAVRKLEEQSAQIGSVSEVIRGIADQTNLLALNAAIEAARAGQQGRGFAVVADEVRTLAGRTAQSTEEIQSIINHLQSGTAQAVKSMAGVSASADAGVSQVSEAGESLKAIIQAVTSIHDLNTQIAAAAEEQSAVAEEVNENVHEISGIAEQTSDAAIKTSEASEQLQALTANLRVIVDQYQR